MVANRSERGNNMETVTEEQEESVTAAAFLADVLFEMKSLAEAAIRLAAAQSDWRCLDIAVRVRENALYHQRELEKVDSDEW